MINLELDRANLAWNGWFMLRQNGRGGGESIPYLIAVWWEVIWDDGSHHARFHRYTLATAELDTPAARFEVHRVVW